MKVDISGITRVNGASLDLKFEEALSENRVLSEDYIIDNPASFNGTLTNINGILKLEGRLKTGYRVTCYRCLKETEGQLDIKISESFVNGKSDSDEMDSYVYEGNVLELDNVLEDNIILNLPMKQVCMPECRGLCPMCGTNLNEGKCDCHADTMNPQMEELKKFFNN